MAAPARTGFALDRPRLFLRLPPSAGSTPETAVRIRLFVKLKSSVFKSALGLAAAALIWPPFQSAVRTARRVGRGRVLWISLTGFAVGGGALAMLTMANGVGVWTAILAAVVAFGFGLERFFMATGGADSPAREVTRLLAISLGALALCATLFETYLGLRGETPERPVEDGQFFMLPPEVVTRARARSWPLTLPDSWRHRQVDVDGASDAYYWHDALHIRDNAGFRRLNGELPNKDAEVFRILTVGDSLTYGLGVPEAWTYSRILERALNRDHRVEVLNLGVSGNQSEDVLDLVMRYVPRLQPDLVVYGVCLNDFLPSRTNEYRAFAFPLPEAVKEFLLQRTRLAGLVDDGYQKALLATGLQRDFFDDILDGSTDYRARFARDVAAMNAFVVDNGLAPIVGIVVHQFPNDPRSWPLIESAEDALRGAGFDLVSIRSWRERFGDRDFKVSRWEGHPNELAFSLVAEALHQRIAAMPDLMAFAK